MPQDKNAFDVSAPHSPLLIDEVTQASSTWQGARHRDPHEKSGGGHPKTVAGWRKKETYNSFQVVRVKDEPRELGKAEFILRLGNAYLDGFCSCRIYISSYSLLKLICNLVKKVYKLLN